MLDWKLLNQQIESSQRILLSTHENPDGDGLGSACAMYHYLKDNGKDCKIIHMSKLPAEYKFLNYENIIQTYQGDIHDNWLSKIDLAIIFDIGDYQRLRDIGDLIEENKIYAINIDHHPNLKDKRFSENFIDVNAAATGEMVYDFFKSVNVDLNKYMAEGIYTAVMTDTGSFRYSNTNEKSHRIAIESLNLGVDNAKIYQTIYENRSPQQISLLAKILDVLDYDLDGQLAWFVIDQKMLIESGAKNKDVDGFSDFVRTIKGVEVAVMFFEIGTNVFRVNFRSKGKYVINDVAKAIGGGGHKFAAGAITKGDSLSVTADVLSKAKSSLLLQNKEKN